MTEPVFEFRSLTERDLPLLFEWLNRPQVAEWWGGEDSFDAVQEEYLPEVRDPADARPYLAYLDGRPVAYIQSYSAVDTGDGWWPDQHDKGVVGIDQFLAEPTDLGRGLGTALVKQFAAFLFSDPAVTRIQVDPGPANLRAIRCYEKAGFQRQEIVTTPDGPALLMTLDPPSLLLPDLVSLPTPAQPGCNPLGW
jgi:RimJ/RimL family protein N-acetyltransferase